MNKNSEHIDEKMLLRFLLGEANQDEMQQVANWLQMSDANQKLLDQYEAIWAETGKLTPHPVTVDKPAAWSKMSDKIDQYENQKTSIKTVSIRSRLIWISSSIAAAIVIIFGIYQIIKKPSIENQNLIFASTEKVLNDTLPDGSEIALNAHSKITYPKQFAQNERLVKLEGEAFFHVKPNKEKPFIIETGNAFVQVLGTSFNVKELENNEIEVVVTEGLVKLYTVDSETIDTSAILLKAGQKGKLTADRKPVYVSENIPDELFWMNYTLIFNDTDLKKVFKLLEDHYKVKINVSDQRIFDCRLTTTFSNHSIHDIIEVIAATFEFEFTQENNTYTIKGNGCAEKTI